jgi:hypothetical protein
MFGLISSSLNEMRAFTALMRVNLVENCPLKHRKVAVVGTGCYTSVSAHAIRATLQFLSTTSKVDQKKMNINPRVVGT